MSDAQDQGPVFLHLTRAQALVLFEWLSRADGGGAAPVEDAAEKHVLWQLEGQLESNLNEPFRSDYKELLAAARKEVRELKQ
jgi:hypothetical protein